MQGFSSAHPTYGSQLRRKPTVKKDETRSMYKAVYFLSSGALRSPLPRSMGVTLTLSHLPKTANCYLNLETISPSNPTKI